MSIQRNLKLLLPKENHKDSSSNKPSAAIGMEGSDVIDSTYTMDAALDTAGVARSTGHAGLETGNHFNNMPQSFMEIRASAETAFTHGDVIGAYPIYLDEAQVQMLNLTGDATLSFDLATWTPRAYNSGQDHGIDVAVTLLISKGATALSIPVDYWAPFNEIPDLSRAGFYEIGIAYCRVGLRTTIRGYPAIRPTPV